jgi:hypothetical protein
MGFFARRSTEKRARRDTEAKRDALYGKCECSVTVEVIVIYATPPCLCVPFSGVLRVKKTLEGEPE